MSCTIVAQVVDRDGVAAWWWTGSLGGRHLEEARAHPAAAFDDIQPGVIPIKLQHDGPTLGHVSFLEHGIGNSDLTAVGVLDDVNPEEVAGLFCSAEITAAVPRGGMIAERCQLDGLALCGRTAGVGAVPVKAFPGDFRYSRTMGFGAPAVLDRAREAHRTETRSTTLLIHRPIKADKRIAAALAPIPTVEDLSRALEVRSALTLDVHERGRIVEVVAAPIDTLATVLVRGALVTESFAAGAFAGDEHRAGRVKANREHRADQLVGKAVAIDPYSKLGCVATLRISATPLGDETLELAKDRVLDASAGFRAPGERWNAARTHRTITCGQLDHVALCQSPAYETAAIIDVRGVR
jgi:hypothetical protein